MPPQAYSELPWEERFAKTADGLTLCWQSLGNPDHPPIVLVAGLGCQLTMWPDSFCQQLVFKGFRVIRFDNRDMGFSSEVNNGIRFNIPVDFMRARFGLPIRSNYQLPDMAKDAVQLLDAIGIQKAHFVGVSMGGMISQIIAAQYPERVEKLTLVMTSTNAPHLPGPTWNVLNNMFLKKPRDASVEAFCDHIARVFTAIGSPDYPTPPEQLRKHARLSFERSRRAAGVLRQTNAIMSTGSIEKYTQKVKAPTLVIHGAQDPLLRPACGERVAKLIGHSRLELIPGMGHDLPEGIVPTLTSLIGNHCA